MRQRARKQRENNGEQRTGSEGRNGGRRRGTQVEHFGKKRGTTPRNKEGHKQEAVQTGGEGNKKTLRAKWNREGGEEMKTVTTEDQQQMRKKENHISRLHAEKCNTTVLPRDAHVSLDAHTTKDVSDGEEHAYDRGGWDWAPQNWSVSSIRNTKRVC